MVLAEKALTLKNKSKTKAGSIDKTISGIMFVASIIGIFWSNSKN